MARPYIKIVRFLREFGAETDCFVTNVLVRNVLAPAEAGVHCPLKLKYFLVSRK